MHLGPVNMALATAGSRQATMAASRIILGASRLLEIIFFESMLDPSLRMFVARESQVVVGAHRTPGIGRYGLDFSNAMYMCKALWDAMLCRRLSRLWY